MGWHYNPQILVLGLDDIVRVKPRMAWVKQKKEELSEFKCSASARGTLHHVNKQQDPSVDAEKLTVPSYQTSQPPKTQAKSTSILK